MIVSVKFHTEDGSALKIETDAGEAIVPAGRALLGGDLADWLAAGNVIAPYYTIVGAEYANAEGSAVMAMTIEAGRVLVTQSPGKADRWAVLQAWRAAGGEIAHYAPRPVPAPAPDPAAQFNALKRLMIDKGIASEAEINAATAKRDPG